MRARYFFLLSVVGFVVGLAVVVNNRVEASRLAANLEARDARGQDTTAETARLERHARSHMLTSTSVFLSGSYNKTVAAAQAATVSQANGAVYSQAQATCGQRGRDSVSQARCVQDYVSTHAQAQPNPRAMVMPDQADYTRVFKSRLWTPDSAGLAFLVATAGLAMALIKLRSRKH